MRHIRSVISFRQLPFVLLAIMDICLLKAMQIKDLLGWQHVLIDPSSFRDVYVACPACLRPGLKKLKEFMDSESCLKELRSRRFDSRDR